MLRGERKAKEERKEKDYFYREVSYGRFERGVLSIPALGFGPSLCFHER
jgi:HSP20 family molecular chaperone IbpA